MKSNFELYSRSFLCASLWILLYIKIVHSMGAVGVYLLCVYSLMYYVVVFVVVAC